jgi:hypothetical protein
LVNPLNGSVSNVTFSSANPSIVSVSPASDSTSSYQTTGTGVSVGSTSITANVYMGGVFKCTDNSSVSVISPDPWWQVKDADVSTNGDLNSDVPASAGLFFDDIGAGGYPGVPSYGDTTNLNGANVSETGWLVNSSVTNSKVYNVDHGYPSPLRALSPHFPKKMGGRQGARKRSWLYNPTRPSPRNFTEGPATLPIMGRAGEGSAIPPTAPPRA